MIPTLNTQRLTLRPFNPGDAPAYFAIRSDPQVARFLAGSRPDSVEDSARSIQRITDHWAEYHYGIWAVIERANGRLIGQCGLWTIPDTQDIELAYALATASWGKGYATEAGRAALNDGFSRLNLPVIHAVAYPENIASRRVLEKLGMRFEGINNRYYGKQLAVYMLEKPEAP